MSDNGNPSYKDRGLFLSPEDHELITGALVEKMTKIQNSQPEHIDKIGPMTRLMTRLSHVVIGGQGMTPTIAERYARRIQDAMRKQDSEKLSAAFSALLAAVIRLDPDPAEYIGQMMIAQLGEATGAIGKQMLTQWMNNLGAVLQEAKSEWDRSAYPSGAKTLAWIMDTVSAGIEDVVAGHEPWAVLDESEPANDPAAPGDVSNESGSEAPSA